MSDKHRDIIDALRLRPGSTVDDLAATLLVPAARDLAAELKVLEAAGQVRSECAGSQQEWFVLSVESQAPS